MPIYNIQFQIASQFGLSQAVPPLEWRSRGFMHLQIGMGFYALFEIVIRIPSRFAMSI